MSGAAWHVWRPSKGQEYTSVDRSTGLTFSNLESNLIVAEGIGDVSWDAHANTLLQLFNQTADRGFFFHCPWTAASAAVLESHADSMQLQKHGRCYFGDIRAASDLARLLHVWGLSGAANSGEWRMAGFRPALSRIPTQIMKGDIDLAVAFKDSLGFLLSLSEMKQATLFLKAAPGVEQALRTLVGDAQL